MKTLIATTIIALASSVAAAGDLDICQDRCRLFDHAARHFSSLLRSGFNATDPTGSQFRTPNPHTPAARFAAAPAMLATAADVDP